MATKLPGARWRPIRVNYTNRKRARTDAVVLHVTASNAASQFAWFNNPRARASAHLHIALDGTVEQHVDLDKIAWGSGDGNARVITIETAGTGSGRWTTAQLAALERTLAWLCERYSIPAALLGTSRAGERGIGWHRLGIDGNFPSLPDIRAGRIQRGGGERWSSSRGKVCPGDDRIRQVPALVERVAEILTPPVLEEDEMYLIRRLGATHPKRKYALVSGGRVIEVGRTTARRLKAAGVPELHLHNTDYDKLVKEWK